MFSSVCSAVPTLVQATSGVGLGSGDAVTLGSTVTVGHTILAAVRWSYFPCGFSLTDSLGNTYTTVGAQADGDGGVVWLSAPVTTGGPSDVITLHSYCGVSSNTWVTEYSGVSGILDAAVNADGYRNASSPCYGGSLTTSTAGNLVIGVYSDVANRGQTANSGWTTRATTANGAIWIDQVQSPAGPINPSATCSANDSYPTMGYSAAFRATDASSIEARILN